MTGPEVDTPKLVLNVNALERNLRRMADAVRPTGVALRPHTKTHKSPWVAGRQVTLGAVGVCTAKLGEAEVMLRSGIRDVLITTEVIPAKIDRLLNIATLGSISVVIDSVEVVAELGRHAVARGVELGALVDVNVGQERTGTNPGADAVAVARAIADTNGLRFLGIQGYEGHCQQVFEYADQRRRAFESYERLALTRRQIVDAGIPVPCVTTAGTGTYRFAIEHGVPTEVQPGSYVVMDDVYRRVERLPFENALFIVASVVSTNRSGWVIVDAGWKTVSTDAGVPAVRDYPGARYEPAGDEHGRVYGLPRSAARIGEQVWFVPSHCDTTINLYDHYELTDDGGRYLGRLPIAARGAST
jgi:D-serine deaminase-like pyridoxal phosphate-dependent protein